MKVIDQLLGPADGEGGHDQAAASLAGLVDHLFQLSLRLFHGRMLPVAVGALHQQNVCFVEKGRVAQDGPVRPAQIPAEDQAHLAS